MKWFKHDTDASHDAKLQNVLLDYGLEGYGLYWYCLELIAGRVDADNVEFELEHDARVIARNTGSTAQKVDEMLSYFAAIGLFERVDGVISCAKMAKRLDKSMTSNIEMRKAIEKMRSDKSPGTMTESPKSHDSIMTASEKVMQEEKRLEEKRLDRAREPASRPITLHSFIAKEREAGKKFFTDALKESLDKTGIPADLIMLEWGWFKENYSEGQKKYKDWRKVFLKAVVGAWGNLWSIAANGDYYLTTAGKQVQAMQEREQ